MTQPRELSRVIGTFAATTIVVGTVIGTGIFLKPATMAQSTGSTVGVFLAWGLAAVLSLAGALTYAELGARFPMAGGEYAYLREAYGRFPGFMFGWMRFWIGSPGSIAAFAVGAATFLGKVVDLSGIGGETVVAVAFVALFTATNALGIALGARVHATLTVVKVLAIVGLVAAILIGSPAVAASPEPGAGAAPFAGFMAAVLAALWAFDGWNNLAMVGGELKDPQRTLPRALLLGMGLVTALYLLASFAYSEALPFDAIAASRTSANKLADPVATNALAAALGPGSIAVPLVSLLFVISAVGAMSGSILTGARVPFAMARDGLGFRALGKLSQTSAPVTAIVAQGAVALALALSGTFDQLTDAVLFASWIFYGANGAAVVILRRRAGPPTTFKTPLYPVLPALFVVMSAALVVSTAWSEPVLSAIGLGVMALGVPVYLLLQRPARN